MLSSEFFRFRLTTISAFDVARILILADMVAIAFSPVLVNVIEFFLIITVLSSKSLRLEIVEACKFHLPVQFLFAFVGWMILAMSWGEASFPDRLQEIISWRKLLLFPLVLAIATTEFRVRMLVVISLTGITCAGVGWILGIDSYTYMPRTLMRSDVVQTIYFALATLALWSLLGLYRGSKSLWIQMAFIVGMLFLIGTIANSTGRSGYLFLVVGCCCFVYSYVKKHRFLVALSLALSLLVSLTNLPAPAKEIRQGLEEIIAVTDPSQDPQFSSMGIRLVMWDHSIQMIMNKPFLGSGAGSFEVDYKRVAESRSEGWRAGRSSDPHQQYLHVAAEYGLVGLGLLILFLGSLIHRLRLNCCTVFGLSVLLGLVATSFFNGHLSSLVEGRMFWILVPLFLLSKIRRM